MSSTTTKFVFFLADRKTKTAILAFDMLRQFLLLLCATWTDFNATWQKARSQRPLSSLCILGRSENQHGRPGLWLAEAFLLLLCDRWTEFNETWQEARSQRPLCFFFFWPIEKKQQMAALASDWLRHFQFLLCNRVTDLNETWQEARYQGLYQDFVLGSIGKSRWQPLSLIGWGIFDVFSATALRNSTKLYRKQDLNVLCQFCVFRDDRKNQDGHTGLWLAEIFSTSSLKQLNGIQ